MTWFSFFSNCFLVTGHAESLIYDTDRNDFYKIPNRYIQILNDTKIKDLEYLKRDYGQSIVLFLDQFVSKELGFYTDEPNLFKPIDLKWESPYVLNNAVLEVSKFNFLKIISAIKELDKLGCIGFQIRFIEKLSVSKIEKILKSLNCSRIKYVEILYPFSNLINYESFRKLINNYPRIIAIKIFGAPKFKVTSEPKLILFSKDILSNEHEIISPKRFVTELGLFSEAQSFNIGLNRKISINRKGEIMNYLTHSKVMGIIGDDKLEDVVSKPSFQRLWDISNDKIEKCSSCQYRYTCVSNSDIKKIKGKYFKLNTCDFNPINNQWN